ncbi:Acetyl-coenzyme A carboxylase carboxyl transferase subunit alpha [Rhodanobacter lindaniclasticus]
MPVDGQAFNIDEEVARLRQKVKVKTADIFRNLDVHRQTTELSRHPARPYTLDYIGVICRGIPRAGRRPHVRRGRRHRRRPAAASTVAPW